MYMLINYILFIILFYNSVLLKIQYHQYYYEL